jgi:hypothetical protein
MHCCIGMLSLTGCSTSCKLLSSSCLLRTCHVSCPAAGKDAASVMDGASSAGGSETDKAEDLTADFRRAKRLKKLKHMLAGAQVEKAVKRFTWQMYLIMMVMLAVHVACFVIFDQQVQQQHT